MTSSYYIRRIDVAGRLAVGALGVIAAHHVLERLHVSAIPVWVDTVLVGLVVILLPLLCLLDRWWRAAQARVSSESSELVERRRHDIAERERVGEIRDRVQRLLATGDGLQMAFQPIVDLAGGDIVGYEALARFSDGKRPDLWFAEAASVGLGVELEVLAASLALDAVGGTNDAYVSVNLSPAVLASPAFGALFAGQARPELVVVELTEHVVVDDYGPVAAALDMVRGRGGRVAVDDAGSGYASMRHIVALAPELIKLDRSLIAGIDADPVLRSLVTALLAFATSIGARVVAEGVETEAEGDACRAIGLHAGQGYLFGRPAPFLTTVTSPGP